MVSVAEKYLLLCSIPIYFVVILLEIVLSNLHMKHFYSLRETLMNLYFTVLNSGIDLLFRGVYLSALFFMFEWSVFDWASKGLAYWVLLFILEDLAFYVEHRMDHYCRLLWAVHVTHHSSPEYNLTTGFRSSVLQPLYRFLYFLPIAMLGFEPLDILFMFSVTQIYGIVLHTQYVRRMPAWFEAVFVSPSHHRVHHASNVIYLDRNMGMCLIIWDKLFGTFQKELEEEPVRYGITRMPAQPYHPLYGISHEFSDLWHDLKLSPKWAHKFRYLFGPPGWSHDGKNKTANQLRKELENGRIRLHTIRHHAGFNRGNQTMRHAQNSTASILTEQE